MRIVPSRATAFSIQSRRMMNKYSDENRESCELASKAQSFARST
jgi:hypothetical protein